MDNHKISIAANLKRLRQANHLTIEEIADKVGVSRQAIAKWEKGTSLPDIINCAAIARLYDIPVDTLLCGDVPTDAASVSPSGKHFFGTLTIGADGTIHLPKGAREPYHITPGARLTLLGNEVGLALVPEQTFMGPLKNMFRRLA